MWQSLTKAREALKGHSLLVSCSFLHLLGDGFAAGLNPLLPFIAAAFGLSYAKAGGFKSCYEALYSTLQLPTAFLAERLGGVLFLAGAMTWLSVGLLLIGLAAKFGQLLIFGALAGAGGSAYHAVGTSLVSQAYAGSRRGSAIGVLNSAGDVGKAALAFVAAYMAGRYGWRSAFFLLGCLGVAGSLLLLRSRPERERAKASFEVASDSAGGGWGIDDKGGFSLLTSIGMLDCLCRSGALTFLSFLLVEKDVAAGTIGLFFAIVYVSGALGKLGCGPLADKWGNFPVVMATKGATALLVCLLVPVTGVFLAPLLVAFGFVLEGTSSALYSAVAQFVSVERRPRGYGIYYTLILGASACAPITFGFIADRFNLDAVFFGIGLVALSIVPLSLLLSKRKKGG